MYDIHYINIIIHTIVIIIYNILLFVFAIICVDIHGMFHGFVHIIYIDNIILISFVIFINPVHIRSCPPCRCVGIMFFVFPLLIIIFILLYLFILLLMLFYLYLYLFL